MLELGQPLHAFDCDTLARRPDHRPPGAAGRAASRRSTAWSATLDPEMLVIADAERPVAIAGVMGGAETEVEPSARPTCCWSRRTSSRAASGAPRAAAAAERGVAPLRARRGPERRGAADRAAQLIAQLAGGQAAAGHVDVYPGPEPARTITVTAAGVSGLLGQAYSADVIGATLRSLGFGVDRPHPDPSPGGEGVRPFPLPLRRGARPAPSPPGRGRGEGSLVVPCRLPGTWRGGHRRGSGADSRIRHDPDGAAGRAVARAVGGPAAGADGDDEADAGGLWLPGGDRRTRWSPGMSRGGWIARRGGRRARRRPPAPQRWERGADPPAPQYWGGPTYGAPPIRRCGGAARLGGAADSVHNPMSQDRGYLRATFGESAGTVAANVRHRERVDLFEVASVYLPPLEPLPTEVQRLGLALTGPRAPVAWNVRRRRGLLRSQGRDGGGVAGAMGVGGGLRATRHPTSTRGKARQCGRATCGWGCVDRCIPWWPSGMS